MSSLKKQPGKVYWRSLAELADEPEFKKNLEKEFPGQPLGDAHSFSRRRFMQLMGASLALSSGSACRWEKEHILPFTRRPGGHMPGVPQHYATTMEFAGYGHSLLATSYDGRPIKVDGNPQHPISKGGSTSFAQASVLELYDPDRSRGIVSRAAGQDTEHLHWHEFEESIKPIIEAERASGGAGLRVLSEFSSSPTQARLAKKLAAAFPKAKWVEYEPLSRDSERLGTALAFGQGHRPFLALDRAQVIVSLDDDFLVDHPASTRYSRDFAQHRKPKSGSMCRLYAIESRYSTTGAMADHRLPLRSAQIKTFLLALVAEILKSPTYVAPADMAPFRDGPSPNSLGEGGPQFVRAIAKELLANQSKSVVTVGPGQPPEVHALAAQLNVILNNAGSTVTYTTTGDEVASGAAAIAELTDEMGKGNVSTLIILGGNPAFNAPMGVAFRDALAKVKTSVHLGLYRDETGRLTNWHLPRAHYLESWGDARSYDGILCLLQPLIKPIFNGKTPSELLALLLGESETKGRELTKQTFAELLGTGLDTDKKWHDAVRDGFVASTAWAPVTPVRKSLAAMTEDKSANARLDNGSLELSVWADSHVYDGRFANNGWLQELPDFMTKVTWDGVALFAPGTAAALGIEHQTLVKLKVDNAEVTTAAYIMPGQAAGTVAITLGYGRTEAGHVAGTAVGDVESVGFNTYGIFHGGAQNFVGGLTVTSVGKGYELAITQDHHALDALAESQRAERVPEIVREANLEDFEKEPNFVKEMVEHPPLESLWKEFDYDTGHRWGMAIDLSACVGCNACIVACQAENNIPIVGKEQVINGREMHWLRIDRYFAGDPASPTVATQPMTCQQCENAPCESVCPVAATVHSAEGLNDMVYNRCIGTRYCSNNCPYKVRRFNFFNYHKNLVDPANQVAKMVYNPEVTVRARGVMEKCNYCVQRIQNVKIVAHNAKRSIEDGEIVTACAQACPAEAISFGDLNDVKSTVAKQQADSRAYAVLEQLNTKPRTLYLAKIRNPNPELS